MNTYVAYLYSQCAALPQNIGKVDPILRLKFEEMFFYSVNAKLYIFLLREVGMYLDPRYQTTYKTNQPTAT